MTHQEEIDAIKAWAWDEKVEASKRILELEALLEAQRQETYKAVEREHTVKKQLTEQARELERLKAKWGKRRQGLIDHYESQYNDLLRVAVKFAGYCNYLDEAIEFLATPAAMAVQQAKGDK